MNARAAACTRPVRPIATAIVFGVNAHSCGTVSLRNQADIVRLIYVPKKSRAMTADRPEGARRELAPTIARCTKCGRGFVTLPRDNIDHFRRQNGGDRDDPSWECGGLVVLIEDARP